MVGASLRGMPASCSTKKRYQFLKLEDCRLMVMWVLRYLQLHQGESSAGSNAAVVLDRRTSDNWS